MTKKITRADLKKLIKEEVSIAQKDANAAKAIKRELEGALKALDKAYSKINGKLSTFNAPGLSAALTQAIHAGRPSAVGGSGKFDLRAALNALESYYKAHEE
jgi:hypothetical protein